MSQFTLHIDTDNAAFDPEPVAEVKRILAGVVECLDEGWTYADLLDSNGNVVGGWRMASGVTEEVVKDS